MVERAVVVEVGAPPVAALGTVADVGDAVRLDAVEDVRVAADG
jgi:hypothetical protein